MTGCTARELESRRFPLVLEINVKEDQLLFACAWPELKEDESKTSSQTFGEENAKEGGSDSESQMGHIVNSEKITRVFASSMQEALRNMQCQQDKYVDYSQVKAIIWGKELVKESPFYKEVVQWLEDSPQFAGNILVFQGETRDLNLETIQEHAKGQPGAYLENLYKNNVEFQKYTKTLREVLFF